MSLRDEMGSEALRGAQRKKKRNGFRREEHNEKRKEMGSEERGAQRKKKRNGFRGERSSAGWSKKE